MNIRFESRTMAEAEAEALNVREPGQWFTYKSDFVSCPWIVAKLPQVGEKVSEAFNGDSYPRGEIVKVSPTGKKVTTSTGHVFYRDSKRPGRWASGGFSMIKGHVEKQNPHF
jgi:hypothetical protein